MTIEEKVEQMYQALADMQVTEKLSSIKPVVKRVGNEVVTSVDFTKGADRATAANRISSLQVAVLYSTESARATNCPFFVREHSAKAPKTSQLRCAIFACFLGVRR
jgi:hypothetical protein